MIIRTALASALILSVPVAAPALAQNSSEQADSEEALDDDDKMVCRREAVIGSRFKKRVCATKKEWRELAERGRSDTEDIQRRGFVPGVEPG
ncbi:hypothetical protein [Erythrobacter sp.]|jgi:hypothetical protein|uniref:hypothetical protein n=1 Tax=Erythrobacter sp. TaxID=1042 RepID=UPI002EAC382D|nr:hypothetical protein [Erythrobacter sp.]